jgi:hypothetical protein
MLAHPLPGPRRRTHFWRYTLAQRVYGARFGGGQRLRGVLGVHRLPAFAQRFLLRDAADK